MTEIEKADHQCCLYRLGSVTTPKCMVLFQQAEFRKKGFMGKKFDDITSPPGACAGRSLVEMMEDELDKVFNDLKENRWGPSDPETNNLKGKAQGIATCLAIIQNPYYPSVDGVKADAVGRWEHRQLAFPGPPSAGSE